MTTWKAFKVDPTKLYLLFIIKHNHVYKHDRHISSTFVCWNWNCNLSKQTMIAINDSSNTRHFRKTTNNFTKHYLHNILISFSIANKLKFLHYPLQGNSRLENVSCREHFGNSVVDTSMSLSFRTDSYSRPRSEQGFQFRLFAAINKGRQLLYA